MQTKIRLTHQRLILLGVFFLADRLLKNIIWFSLPRGERYFFIQSFLNEDIAFSISLPGLTNSALIVLLTIVTVGVTWESVRLYKLNDGLFFWWGMIALGAVSNILDRIQLGGVLDYIDLGFFPVFNMSDAYITFGVLFIILFHLQQRRTTTNA